MAPPLAFGDLQAQLYASETSRKELATRADQLQDACHELQQEVRQKTLCIEALRDTISTLEALYQERAVRCERLELKLSSLTFDPTPIIEVEQDTSPVPSRKTSKSGGGGGGKTKGHHSSKKEKKSSSSSSSSKGKKKTSHIKKEKSTNKDSKDSSSSGSGKRNGKKKKRRKSSKPSPSKSKAEPMTGESTFKTTSDEGQETTEEPNQPQQASITADETVESKDNPSSHDIATAAPVVIVDEVQAIEKDTVSTNNTDDTTESSLGDDQEEDWGDDDEYDDDDDDDSSCASVDELEDEEEMSWSSTAAAEEEQAQRPDDDDEEEARKGNEGGDESEDQKNDTTESKRSAISTENSAPVNEAAIADRLAEGPLRIAYFQLLLHRDQTNLRNLQLQRQLNRAEKQVEELSEQLNKSTTFVSLRYTNLSSTPSLTSTKDEQNVEAAPPPPPTNIEEKSNAGDPFQSIRTSLNAGNKPLKWLMKGQKLPQFSAGGGPTPTKASLPAKPASSPIRSLRLRPWSPRGSKSPTNGGDVRSPTNGLPEEPPDTGETVMFYPIRMSDRVAYMDGDTGEDPSDATIRRVEI